MTDASRIEQAGLRLTVGAAAFMAVLGIGFYFPTRSEAILLDGLFSLVGFFVSLLTLKVARMVQKPDDEHFHFGYGAFEPLLNLFKGLMIGGVCVFAFVPAVQALFRGGRPLQSGPAVVYAFIAAAGCFAMWWSQGQKARQVNSPLLDVDVHQWLMDGAISSAVGVAFIGGAILQRGPLAAWVDYLDPLLVIVLVIVTARVPFEIVRSNLWELLLGAPGTDVQRQLAEGVRSVLHEKGFDRYRFRMVKAGRSHLLLLHVCVPDDRKAMTVADFDTLRAGIQGAVPPELAPFTIDVVFTRDESCLA